MKTTNMSIEELLGVKLKVKVASDKVKILSTLLIQGILPY
jgi:hypothetical protein